MDDDDGGPIGFSFSSKPRPVQKVKAKYRDEEDKNIQTVNIMSDPRVIRGSSYAAGNAFIGKASKTKDKKPKSNQRTSSQKSDKTSIYEMNPITTLTVPLDLDDYLIEQKTKIPETEISTQTDEFIDSDFNVNYIPPKSGIDGSTQIEESDNLFNFDLELGPLLQVIVNKTLDQAQMEVEEELELESIKNHLENLKFDKKKEEERVKSLESQSKEAFEQKKQLVVKQKALEHKKNLLEEKICALSLSKNNFSTIEDSSFQKLEKSGVFYDPITKSVKSEFMEWMYSTADDHLHDLVKTRGLVDDILKKMFNDQNLIQKQHNNLPEEGFIRILVKGKGLNVDVIGPIPVSIYETMKDVNTKIEFWMEQNVPDCEHPREGYLKLAFGDNFPSSTRALLETQIIKDT